MDERENLLEYETLIHLSDESICELLQKGCCTIVGVTGSTDEEAIMFYLGMSARSGRPCVKLVHLCFGVLKTQLLCQVNYAHLS